MQVSSSKETPKSGRWALNLYLVLAGLIQLGILLQGFLIGALLFAGAAWGKNLHGTMGLVLLIMALLLALVGLLTPMPGRIKVVGFVFFALVIIQMLLASLGSSVPLVAALHPANAMILFGLNIFLIIQARRIMQGV